LGSDERACAFVDWLGFTLALPPAQSRSWLDDAIETTFRVPRERWVDTGKDWYGYKRWRRFFGYGYKWISDRAAT